MAYKFEPVINPYVDPGSVKVSEILNERFSQNFAVQDALQAAMRDMQYAPFENDTALAKEIRQTTDQKLEEFASRGDFENLTFPLHSLAVSAKDKLKPLADNYTRYANTLNDLSERLKKGDVNPEQYDLYKGYMSRGYKGLEFDENNRVKQGSEFTAPMLYNDPKIMDRVAKRLEILHTQKTGRTTSGLQQAANGDLLVVEEGGSLTKIADKDVQDVLNAVLQESDVKMYLDQMSTMKALKTSDSYGGPDKLIQAQVANIQDNIGKLNSELNSGKYNGYQKREILNTINGLNKQLANFNSLTSPEEGLNQLKAQYYNEMVRPIREFASKKGGIYEQTSVYKVDNLTARERNRLSTEFHFNNPTMYSVQDISATNFGGKNTAEKLNNIRTNQASISELEQVLQTGTKKNDQGQDVKLDQSELETAERELNRLKSDNQIIESQIKQAVRNSMSFSELRAQDPTLIDEIAKMYQTQDPGEIYYRMQQIFDNPQDQDYLNFEAAFNGTYGENSLTNHTKEFYPLETYTPVQQKGLTGTLAALGILSLDDNSPISVFNNKFGDKINEGLKEVKTSNVFVKDKVVALTPDLTRQYTKVFDNNFTDKPLIATATYTDGEGNDIKGSQLAGYKIKSYYTPGNGAAGDVMAFDIEGKDANDNPVLRTVYMTTDQFTSPDLQAVYNSNTYKLGKRINQAGNVGSFNVDVTTGDGNTRGNNFTLKFDDVNRNGKPLVTIIKPDGTPLDNLGPYIYGGYYDPNDPKKQLPVTGAMDPASELFTNFISLPYFHVH